MTKWFDTDLPCPCGEGKSSYAIDVEGNGFCFKCSKFFGDSEGDDTEVVEEKTEELDSEGLDYDYIPHRGISKYTFEFFDVKSSLKDKELYQTGFYYPGKGYKIRSHSPVDKKRKWFVKGEMNSPGLYGKDKFDPGSKDIILITEGMYDGLSSYDMLRGRSVACVTVSSGSNAKRDCSLDWDYINSFKRIYLCFDSDEAGRIATKEVAPLFDYNKVYHVRLHKYKDPTEYLEKNEQKEFTDSFDNARRFAPDNIISSFAEVALALEESDEGLLMDYPFSDLSSSLYGLFESEVLVIKAPEGVGKSSFFRSLQYHALTTTAHNIGIIHLEEDNATTIKGLVSYELKQNAILPDSGLTKEQILETYKKIVDQDESRVNLYTSFDIDDEQGFLDNLRFMATVGKCKILFFDHISWLATGVLNGKDDDERKKLDRISQKVKLLAKELKICIVVISHVNDTGQTRGSRNITKVADTVIALSRNVTAETEEERNMLYFTIEKARLASRTGPSGKAVYNRASGILEDPSRGIEFNV